MTLLAGPGLAALLDIDVPDSEVLDVAARSSRVVGGGDRHRKPAGRAAAVLRPT